LGNVSSVLLGRDGIESTEGSEEAGS
jgi:hypothetical protein